ncbi:MULTISPECIES: AAA family ATPase [Aeromonas]|uniref:AAA family ATPase n=1 Tax=Aeromonas TaxID=642 RepID=UPI001F2985FA|nr:MULTISPECIES: AAA family ATPase [Aeromonas]MCF5886308.1 AAA family ATPase [Aeromonas veronii]MCP3287812.1 AAA family ATPase [Aeromonas hydrophila]
MNNEIVKNNRTSKNLKNLYLDPNNYRFVDNERHTPVLEANFLDPQVQKRTRSFIEGSKQENIKDLMASFKANGFLDIDMIQVKDLGNNNFLVLEGNRRVTALKSLQEDYEKGLDIGNLDPSVFRSVPFEIHPFDENEKHLIVMGLKHISGNKKWSTFNQSKLLYDYLSPYMNGARDTYFEKENELCDSLGITKTRLRSMIRIYNLILAYKSSDYGDQFTPEKYGIFEEIIKKPVIKTWLEWDDYYYRASNEINQERLFSWISRTENYLRNDSNEDDVEEHDIEEGYEELEPIITKSLEIRDLALFINNSSAVETMERERSLARGLASSGSVDKQNYQSALTKLEDSIRVLNNFKSLVTLEDVNMLSEAKENLVKIIPKKSNLNIEGGNHSICFEFGIHHHFSEINISRYKIFKDFKVKNFNKINIFAGFNNCGKTSLLEALYLLTQQNDISSFFNLFKNKNKESSLSPIFLNKIFNKKYDISGVYNDTAVSIILEKFEANNIDKKDDYISSYRLISKVEDRSIENVVHTFGHETMQRNNDKVERLCPAVFKSPYMYDLDELIRNYTRSVETKMKTNNGDYAPAIKVIVEFLKEIDQTIIDVRFTNDTEIKRFIVESTSSKSYDFDITTYGEGLQRIFYIALSFAASKNGVLLIDEFETAIHYSLLVKFTEFIQKLADTFNVQVFLTTHSNECIKAFVNNSLDNSKIMGYQLINNNGDVSIKAVSGKRLNYLIETINLDIRGGEQ